jgi:hypothetical protein
MVAKISCFFLLALGSAFAQSDSPKKPATPSETVQLAQARVEVAQIPMRVHVLETQVQLYEKILGITDTKQNDVKAVQEAMKNLSDAQERTK